MTDNNGSYFIDVNSRIKEIRVLGRLTQAEFAEKLASVQRSTLANMEAGRNGPSLDTIRNLVINLNKNTDLMRQTGIASRANYRFLFEGETNERQTDKEKALTESVKALKEDVARQNKIIDTLIAR